MSYMGNLAVTTDRPEHPTVYLSSCCDAGIIGEPDSHGFARCGTCMEMSRVVRADEPVDEEEPYSAANDYGLPPYEEPVQEK